MIHSMLLIVLGILAAPYAVGWFMHLTGAGTLGGVIFLTTWLWSVSYWGTLYHSIHVAKIFGGLINGK